MSLFPAYGEVSAAPPRLLLEPPKEGSPEGEDRLLASDSEPEEPEEQPPQTKVSRVSEDADFYCDPSPQKANLRFSTLYYPGRPHYNTSLSGVGMYKEHKREKMKRYWQKTIPLDENLSDKEPSETEKLIREQLRQPGADPELWVHLAKLQSQRGDADAAQHSVERGLALLPHHPELVDLKFSLAREALPHHRLLELIRDELSKERSVGGRCRLWCRWLRAERSAPEGSVQSVRAVLKAAVHDTKDTKHYLHLLYHYGWLLREAGLMEELTVLVELLSAMNLVPVEAAKVEDQADGLQQYEEQLMKASLPLGASWYRVERARAAHYWSPAEHDDLGLDPMRMVCRSAVAELVLPVSGAQDVAALGTLMLLWCGVPLALASRDAQSSAVEGMMRCGGGEAARSLAVDQQSGSGPFLALAPVLQQLQPGQLPPLQRLALMLHDPPDCIGQDHGYMAWVCAVWSSVIRGVAEAGGEDEARALMLWRLRWAAVLTHLAKDESERKQLCRGARAFVRASGDVGQSLLVCAEYAALAQDLAAASRALRLALKDPHTEHCTVLYIARVVSSLCGVQSPQAAWALCCAVLRHELPQQMDQPPPLQLQHTARQQCEMQCSMLEQKLEEESEKEREWSVASWLPRAEQWAALKALLLPPADITIPPCLASSSSMDLLCYHEALLTSACERRKGESAEQLLAAFPHSYTLAYLWGRRPLWRRSSLSKESCKIQPTRLSPEQALCAALPSLLDAAHDQWTPAGAGRCFRGVQRVLRAAGRAASPLLHLVLGEAAARAGRPVQPLVLQLLQAHPHYKWAYGRGVCWLSSGGGCWEDLVDAALEKQLRLHTLPDELQQPHH